MQVSVEKISDLERKMTVELPATEIDQEVNQRLEKLTRTVKLDGFRPGKAPLKEVKRRYEQSVRQEVLGEVMQRSFVKAMNEHELRPAGMPHIHPKVAEEGKGLSFEATFEVYPEITLPDLKQVKVEKPVVTLEDAHVQETIEAIRKQNTNWVMVDRASQHGDQVLIDFFGTLDGKPLERGESKGFVLELGSNSMIPGFEDGILGKKAGDEFVISPSFPEDYHAKELAGKVVDFKINVQRVNEPKLPDLDEAFAKKLKIKGNSIDALHEEVRRNMARELKNTLNNQTKHKVMDALLAVTNIPVPKALIDTEIENMQKNFLQQFGSQGDIKDLIGDKNRDLFEEQSVRRVKLGLLLSEFVKQRDLKVDQNRVRQHIEDMASAYEKPEDVIKWYYNDKARLSEVEALILEDQVVDAILAEAEVTEKVLEFSEVMKSGHQQ